VKALHQVVTRTPGIRRGIAVFVGTRVPVSKLIDHLDRGGTIAEFLHRHPQLSRDLVNAACALGLEALLGTVPLEPVLEQASLLPRVNGAGVIVNPEELGAGQVIGRRVRCPACRTLVFKSWPEGWDSHVATRCRGVKGRDETARKAEFKRRYEHLFR
jgi:uncharacterized protein (DUF433 family)